MRKQSLDSVTYICAMRAAGFCRNLPYLMRLLNSAFADIGANALEVAKTAIINLKYMQRNGNMDSNFGPESAATCMRLAETLYWWVVDKGLQPDAQLMVTFVPNLQQLVVYYDVHIISTRSVCR